jgi:hypothetical protein
MTGFIKLHRKILDWEWYGDINTRCLFIHLVLKANYQDKRWQGITIKAGSLVTSLDVLSKETGLSVQNIRTCLARLKKSKEVTIKITNKYRVISITCFTDYQTNNNQLTSEQQTNNTQTTNEQQADNKQITTTKEEKKVIKKNNLTVIPKKEQFISAIELDLQEPLANWLEYRKDLKDPKQWQFQYNKLKTFSNPQEAVEYSIGQGYRGLFEPKKEFSNRKQGTVDAIREVSSVIENSGLGDKRPPSKYI